MPGVEKEGGGNPGDTPPSTTRRGRSRRIIPGEPVREIAMDKSMNRRQFLGAAAAAGAMLRGVPALGVSHAVQEEAWPPKLAPVKIYKVFAGRTGGIYLSRPTAEVEKLNQHLAQIEKKLGDLQFVGGDMIPAVSVHEVVPKLREADGLILFHLSGHGGDAPQLTKLVDAGLPTAVFSQPYSGHGWMYFPAWKKAGKKVVLLPTSDWNELERVSALMRVAPRLRQTRILAIGRLRGTAAARSHERVREVLGAEIVPVKNEEVIEAHKAVDPQAAEAEARDYWLSKAREVVEPKAEEVVNSARLYLAIRGLMARERARAVTSSHCMGAPAKGCLTFSKLNDEGLVGTCEGDIDSTLTMLMFNYAFGLPGFVTDPVFDVARNALIHFHCTSATKMDGPTGKRFPFRIRTQTDSDRGVALEVENRVGQKVTCAKFINLDTLLISTGKIAEVTRDPLGCRTQFVTEVADARKMFHNWGAGVIQGDVMTLLHRVVFYGDHLQSARDLGDLMGFKVVEEA